LLLHAIEHSLWQTGSECDATVYVITPIRGGHGTRGRITATCTARQLG